MLDCRGLEKSVGDVKIDNLGVVDDIDAEAGGALVKGIQHCPAAAEEKRVSPAEAQRPSKGGLKAHPLFANPIQNLLGLVDHMAGKILLRFAFRNTQQVIKELFLGARAGQPFRW